VTQPNPKTKPEIMSPAGYWPQLHAAIEAGADAVYFGLKHFTARAKVGFGLDELPGVMRTLHQRGVRGYVTFNTLVFDHELGEAATALAEIAKAGADAIIVQDTGIAQLAHKIAPELEVHGSTQMSITSAEGVALAHLFGVNRVVLARELSLEDIRLIRSQTDIELEMFVHGALCVSYSGQCFSSEAWGGRSANRGQCAQACRLPYELMLDGVRKPLADIRYLLSPGDLYTLNEIPEIVKLGVSALKIEGRYKDAGYVALTTAAYRKAVDEAWAGLPLSVTPLEEQQLQQVYSRGAGPYFVSGTNHQTVVHGRAPRHRGVHMGRVVKLLEDGVVIAPEAANSISPLKPGDGIVFDAANWRSPEEREEGGRIYQVSQNKGSSGQITLHFGNGAVNFARIRVGDWVWRSDDPQLDQAVKPFTQATSPVYQRPVQVYVTAHAHAPLQLAWQLVEHVDVQVTVQSDEALSVAQQRALNLDTVRDQLGRLGNTPYVLAGVTFDVSGSPFIPNSLLNQLRRQAVEQLGYLQGLPKDIAVHDPLDILAAEKSAVSAAPRRVHEPQLHVLVRTPEQLDAALELKPASITLDYLELYGLRPAVDRVRAAGITVRVASPRVLKPNEQGIVNFLLRLECEIVVRSGGLLQTLQNQAHSPLIGDFSLNAANVLTADALLKMGLTRITPTHDLNAAQVAGLARAIGPDQLEVIAYQHLPVFHTEHCVFCRFLSNGTSYKDCGHPCETHRVALRDVNGREHPVMADVGCRNTVFGAEAQEASAHLDAWQQAGIRHYRLEFVHETAEQVTQVMRLFDAALHGTLTPHELSRELRRTVPQGTTEGSLFVPPDYLKVPMMQ